MTDTHATESGVKELLKLVKRRSYLGITLRFEDPAMAKKLELLLPQATTKSGRPIVFVETLSAVLEHGALGQTRFVPPGHDGTRKLADHILERLPWVEVRKWNEIDDTDDPRVEAIYRFADLPDSPGVMVTFTIKWDEVALDGDRDPAYVVKDIVGPELLPLV